MPEISQKSLDRCLTLAAKALDFEALSELAHAASPETCLAALGALLAAVRERRESPGAEALAAVATLATRAGPRAIDPETQTPMLIVATSTCWTQGFEALLPLMDERMRDSEGDSVAHAILLREAASRGDEPHVLEMLDALEKRHPALVALARQERSLIDASHRGDLDKLRELLDEGADPRTFCSDWTPALAAAHGERFEILRELLERDPACKDDVDSNRIGLLPLAICGGNSKCVKMALDVCDLDAADDEGETALSLAISREQWTWTLEIARRCDLSRKDHAGRGPLHWLASGMIELSSQTPEEHPLTGDLSGLDLGWQDLDFLRKLPTLLELFCAAPGALEPDAEGDTPWDLLANYGGHRAAARAIKNGVLHTMAQHEKAQIEQGLAGPPSAKRAPRV